MTSVDLRQGNCLEVMAGLEAESVDMIWTDPPYLLSNGGVTCINGQMVSVNKGDWDTSKGLEADHAFNLEWLRECKRVLKPGGSIWVSGTHHVYLSVGMALRELDFRILNDIVWEKPNPPPNLGCRCFTHSTEILLWACKPASRQKSGHTFNYAAMKEENGGKQMKNVWQFTAPGMGEKQYGKHPTQKPVDLVRRCIRATSMPGDIVFDPFMGSGTAGLAAVLEGRQFIGVELNDEYHAMAVRRMKAILEEQGVPESPARLESVA